MTITAVPSNDRIERFTAAPGQTVFPFNFGVFLATDIQVRRIRGTAESVLTYGPDYSITGAGNDGGGTVTLALPALSGDTIVILSNVPYARSALLTEGGDFRAAGFEAETNRQMMLNQQLLRDLAGTLRLSPAQTGITPLPLPLRAARANRMLGFDSQGNPTALPASDGGSSTVSISGGTIALTLAELFGKPTVRPEFWGAVGDGVANDTAALQAAIDSLAATGGLVQLMGGKRYRHTGLTVSGGSIAIAGVGYATLPANGWGTELVYDGAADGNWITVTGDHFAMLDLSLAKADTLTLTDGYAVYMARTAGIGPSLRNRMIGVQIRSPWNGIYLYGFQNAEFHEVSIYDFTGAAGLDIFSDPTRGTIYSMFRIITTRAGTDNGIGCRIRGSAGTMTFSDCYWRDGLHGVLLDANGSDIPFFTKFFRCEAESITGTAYNIQASGYTVIENCYIAVSGLTGSGGHGIHFGPGNKGIMNVINCEIRANGLHGVYVEPSEARGQITDCQIANNSQLTSNTYHGVMFDAGVDGWQVRGGFVGGNLFSHPSNPTQRQRNGITITNGCTNIVVADVDLRGNINAPIFVGTGTDTCRISNCPGYVTRAARLAANLTPNGSGEVVIPHTLDTGIVWYAEASLYGDTPSHGCEIVLIDGTNLTVRIHDESGADVTSGTFDVLWQAVGKCGA